jgi:hypothetical protein
MKRLINNSSLPAPVSLTPEQLAAVASDTSAMLGAGGGLLLTIYGGYPVGPIIDRAAVTSATQINVASVATQSAAIT